MRPRWIRLLLVFAVAVAAAQAYVRLRAPRPLTTGAVAPDFALHDAHGREVRLSALRGRVVAVNFWATWCPPCKAEIPDFAAVYAANQGKCVEFLGVAVESGTHDEITAAAKELGINYPVVFDDDAKVSDEYGIAAYPRTFLVDVKGRLRTTFQGMVDRAQLEAAIAPLLAEAPGSCPRSL
jgi:cytochrome c biogenesis protein CcmG/thiol:disulfide interchange protein DsbE